MLQKVELSLLWQDKYLNEIPLAQIGEKHHRQIYKSVVFLRDLITLQGIK